MEKMSKAIDRRWRRAVELDLIKKGQDPSERMSDNLKYKNPFFI